MARSVESVLCPRRQHAYPENRRLLRITRPGRPAEFYCLACRRERARYEPDDTAVQRAVAGYPPAWLHPEERRRVVLELRSKGVSLSETARRARCTVRHVCVIQKKGRGDVW